MTIKYTSNFLNKLEDIFAETDYMLRYEKGKFNSGYCILRDTKIVIVNKYFPLEGKINSLVDILKTLDLDRSKISDKNRQLLDQINQNQLQL
ncbi:MAG: hypothetical protein ACI9RP_002614 [Cyclobacteriaceae bacterium]|jgi:hypothetical protein